MGHISADRIKLFEEKIITEEIKEDIASSFNKMKLIGFEEEKKLFPFKQYFTNEIKNQFYLYFKSNKISNVFNVDILADSHNLNFDLKTFLYKNSNVFKSVDLIPRTYFTKKYLNTSDESILVLMPIIRNKCYQLYKQFVKPFEKDLDQAHFLVKNNFKVFEGHDVRKEVLFVQIIASLENFIKYYLKYTIDLPGFNKICIEDLNFIYKEFTLTILTLCTNKYYINGECYFMFGNIRQSKKWIYELVGIRAGNYVFDFQKKFQNLNLTEYEIALIFPFVLTSIGIS
jgi:hypothetical protein